MQPVVDVPESLRTDVDRALTVIGERGDVEFRTEFTYAAGDPVRIRLCKRGRNCDLGDAGGAVARAGRPSGWLDALSRVVEADGFNVNRRGVVSVPAFEGRDTALLVHRLAAASRAGYLTLLELDAG
jgi:hypothetical protein